MLFAHLKRILNLTRLRLRGMNGARDEFLLAAIAQNLRRLAKSWHPPPLIRHLQHLKGKPKPKQFQAANRPADATVQ